MSTYRNSDRSRQLEYLDPQGPDGFMGNNPIIHTTVLDTSASMGIYHDAVVEGENLVLESFQGSKQFGDIFVQRFSINYGPLSDLIWVDKQPLLNSGDYRSDAGSTPLYGGALSALELNRRIEESAREQGYRGRYIMMFLTDGLNNVGRETAKDVAAAAQQFADEVEGFVMAALVIGSNADAAGRRAIEIQKKVFRKMGVPEHLILEAKTASEIRAGLQLLSRDSLTELAQSELQIEEREPRN